MYSAKAHSRARMMLCLCLGQLLLALALLASGPWSAPPARANGDGVWFEFKDGQPQELVADGKSQTVLLVQMDRAALCWGEPISDDGSITLVMSASLGSIAPENMSVKPAGFPVEVVFTAGTKSGTAVIRVDQAFFVALGSVDVFGVGSDRTQGMCRAEITIPIGDPPIVPDEEKPAEEEKEEEEFDASMTCEPVKPVEGEKLTCTATVKGAGPKEKISYQWYVGSQEVDGATGQSWAWDKVKADDDGYCDIGLDVWGEGGHFKRLTKSIHVEFKSQEEPLQEDSREPEPPAVEPAQPPAKDAADGAADTAEVEPVDEQSASARELAPQPAGEDKPLSDVGGTSFEAGGDKRGVVERVIEGQERRMVTPREAALAGALTGGAAIVKLMLDLDFLRRGGRPSREASDLPKDYSYPGQLAPGKDAPEAVPLQPVLDGGARKQVPADLAREAAAIGRMSRDLDRSGMERKARDATRGLPEDYLSPVDQDALRQGVEGGAPDPNARGLRGDTMERGRQAPQGAAESRQALDRTLEDVPADLRASDQWQNRISPLLDRAKDWKDPARVRALEDRIRTIVDLRRQIDTNPRFRKLPKEHQNALIWHRRSDSVLGATRSEDRKRLFTNPASKSAGTLRSPASSEGAVRQPDKEVEFIDDLRKYPVRRIESPFRTQQRHHGDDPVTRDLWKFRRVDPHRKGFESGWDKAKRWYREFDAWWDEVRFGIPRKR